MVLLILLLFKKMKIYLFKSSVLIFVKFSTSFTNLSIKFWNSFFCFLIISSEIPSNFSLLFISFNPFVLTLLILCLQSSEYWWTNLIFSSRTSFDILGTGINNPPFSSIGLKPWPDLVKLFWISFIVYYNKYNKYKNTDWSNGVIKKVCGFFNTICANFDKGTDEFFCCIFIVDNISNYIKKYLDQLYLFVYFDILLEMQILPHKLVKKIIVKY